MFAVVVMTECDTSTLDLTGGALGCDWHQGLLALALVVYTFVTPVRGFLRFPTRL